MRVTSVKEAGIEVRGAPDHAFNGWYRRRSVYEGLPDLLARRWGECRGTDFFNERWLATWTVHHVKWCFENHDGGALIYYSTGRWHMIASANRRTEYRVK